MIIEPTEDFFTPAYANPEMARLTSLAVHLWADFLSPLSSGTPETHMKQQLLDQRVALSLSLNKGLVRQMSECHFASVWCLNNFKLNVSFLKLMINNIE